MFLSVYSDDVIVTQNRPGYNPYKKLLTTAENMIE